MTDCGSIEVNFAKDVWYHDRFEDLYPAETSNLTFVLVLQTAQW